MKVDTFINCMRKGVAAALVLASFLNSSGQDGDSAREPGPPEPPDAFLTVPLVVEKGQTTPCLIRGRSLHTVERIEAPAGVQAIVRSTKEAEIPEGWKPEQIGDQQLACEVTVAADCRLDPPSPLTLLLKTASGESTTIDIAVAECGMVVDEKEPNGGFREAQALASNRTARGVIATNKDVDVFHFEAEAGARITVEIVARRCGSALDPLLTVYDVEGFECARSDDEAGNRDARAVFTAPSDGRYHIVLQDAHDTGSTTHVYQVRLTAE